MAHVFLCGGVVNRCFLFSDHRASVLNAVFALLRDDWEALQATDRAFGCQDIIFFNHILE